MARWTAVTSEAVQHHIGGRLTAHLSQSFPPIKGTCTRSNRGGATTDSQAYVLPGASDIPCRCSHSVRLGLLHQGSGWRRIRSQHFYVPIPFNIRWFQGGPSGMEVGHKPYWMRTNILSGNESPHGKAKIRLGHQLGGSRQEYGGLGGSQYHILGGSVHLPSHIQSVVHHLIGQENGSTPEVTSPN